MLFFSLFLKIDGHGIDSMAKIFLHLGYKQHEELRFPAKKLKALWFSHPDAETNANGTCVHGPLPRIFISELLVDQMSDQCQVDISSEDTTHMIV